MVDVVFYTRSDCPLCEEAAGELAALGVPFLQRDVMSDVGLSQEYGTRVPVIEVDGVEVFEGGISAAQIPDILREAGLPRGL